MWLLDTSILVAAYTSEIDTQRAQDWLAVHDVACAISHWTIVEFTSALSAKVRQGHLSAEDCLRARSAFEAYAAKDAWVLPISQRQFTDAAALCARMDIPIRAGDALHVAIALASGLGIATLDQQLLRAVKAHQLAAAKL
jgi:hypothetical protein